MKEIPKIPIKATLYQVLQLQEFCMSIGISKKF